MTAQRDTSGQPRPPGGMWKAAFFALAGLAIIAGAGWALLGSSLLVVRSVAVTGIRAVPRSEVLNAAAIQPGTPLVRVNTAAVTRRVEQIAQVQSARVSRHWPDSVVIAIRERTPVLAVASGGGYALIDSFGVPLGRVARLPDGMAVLAPAPPDLASLRGSPAVRSAALVLHQLPPPVRRLVRTVTTPSPDAVTLRLRGGITVVWGGTGQPATKAAELSILMRTGASYYDLSDPATAVTGG